MITLGLLLLAAPLSEIAAVQEAVLLYQGVELEAAGEKFRAALPEAESAADRATLHAWIGLVHAQLGDPERATASFTEAVKLDPAVKLPAPASPDVEQLLENTRNANQPPMLPIPPPPDPAGGKPPARQQSGPPLAGMIAVGSGAVLLTAGGLTFGIGLDTAFNQAPAAEFNDQARALVDLAYLEYAIAAVLAAAGVVGLGSGAVLLLE